MERGKTIRKHSFFDKHTIMGVILLALANLFFYQILADLGGSIAGNDLAGFIGALGGALILLIFCMFFRNEFAGYFKGNNTSVGIRLAAFMLIYYCYLLAQTAIWGEFRFPSVETIGTCFMAGVSEEAIFRGVIISYLFRQWRDKKRIRLILVISAGLFGLIHALNLLSGANLGITMFQVMGAVGMGGLFAAIYIRSGNILIVMIAHSITDFVAFLDRTQTSESGVMTASFGLPNVIDSLFCVGLFIIALYLVRPAKWQEIETLWNKKWNRE